MLIPIMKTSDLWLFPHKIGDDARFARLFRSTWLRLPLGVSRSMVSYWRDPAHEELRQLNFVVRKFQVVESVPYCTCASPKIELLYGWRGGRDIDILKPPALIRNPLRFPRGHARRAFAVVYAKGFTLRFLAGCVDAMPESVVQDLIAHELGHVYLKAIDWHKCLGTYEGTPEAEAQEELEVDTLIGDWGFGVETIDEWSTAVGLTKTITFETVEERHEYVKKHGTRYSAPQRPK